MPTYPHKQVAGQLFDLMAALDLSPKVWKHKQEIATSLWEMAGAERPAKPWSAVYVQNVITGQVKPSPLFLRAMQSLGASIDDVPHDVAKAQRVDVLSIGRIEAGTLIKGNSRRCANPACRIKFLPTHWNQRYHSTACRRAHHQVAK